MNTIYVHLLQCLDEGKAIEVQKFLSLEEIQMIKEARKALEEPEGLRPYFEFFDEQVPYWKIKYGLYFLEHPEKMISSPGVLGRSKPKVKLQMKQAG